MITDRYYALAEAQMPLLYPLSEANIARLAATCDLHAGTRLLDLQCGQGELLIRWARDYGLRGTGVDERAGLLAQAQLHAAEREVWSQVQFVEADAADYIQPFHEYNVIANLSAYGIADDLAQRIALMQPGLREGERGVLLVGESYWRQPPSAAVCEALGVEPDFLPDLGGLLDQVAASGADLLDVMLASVADWDAYHRAQWGAVLAWLDAQPDSADTDLMRQMLQANQRRYLQHERETLGWGVFVIRVAA